LAEWSKARADVGLEKQRDSTGNLIKVTTR
jgi:hypothetical protein